MRRWKILILILLAFMIVQDVNLSHAEVLNVYHGDREKPSIAITVDDCYDIACVQAVIALCRKYQVPCTFFVIGNALKFKDSQIWQEVVESGCEIGNHSWSHKDLTKMSEHSIQFQMLRTQQKLDELLGYHYAMQVMRPPYGNRNRSVASAVESLGYDCVVTWDVSQTDASKAAARVQNGSILLYHARKKDVRCLKKLIPVLLKRGYTFVTVSELFGLEPVAITEGIYNYAENAIVMASASSVSRSGVSR